MNLLLIASSGGHLYKIFLLRDWWSHHNRIWITPKNSMSVSLLKKEQLIFSAAPDQRFNWLNLIKNTILALRVIFQEKPDLIFSTGSGVAIPFFVFAKIFKIKTIFMETFILISKPTLTGKIIYHLKLADIFLIQNKKLLKYYPNAKYWGAVI